MYRNFVMFSLNVFLLCFRVVDNGVTTVTVEEDGVITSKTVNGEQVALENGSRPESLAY